MKNVIIFVVIVKNLISLVLFLCFFYIKCEFGYFEKKRENSI